MSKVEFIAVLTAPFKHCTFIKNVFSKKKGLLYPFKFDILTMLLFYVAVCFVFCSVPVVKWTRTVLHGDFEL